MLKAVIFDWDGVLVDSLTVIFEWYEYICTKYNKICPFKTKEDIGRIFFEPYPKFYDHIGFNWENDGEIIVAEFHKFIAKQDFTIFDGISEFLQSLKKEKLTLIIGSSGRERRIHSKLKEANIDYLFEFVIGHEDNFDPKPSPEMLHIIMNKMDLKKEEVIYIGDSDSDIQAAKAARIKSIAVTYGFMDKERLLKEQPDFIVDNVEELKEVILNGGL